MKKLFVTSVILLFFIYNSMAQNTDKVEMADALRSSGKIYVVVVIMSIVFIGIAAYLFSIDKRVKKMEQSN